MGSGGWDQESRPEPADQLAERLISLHLVFLSSQKLEWKRSDTAEKRERERERERERRTQQTPFLSFILLETTRDFDTPVKRCTTLVLRGYQRCVGKSRLYYHFEKHYFVNSIAWLSKDWLILQELQLLLCPVHGKILSDF